MSKGVEETDLGATMARACSEDYLEKGRGVLISFGVETKDKKITSGHSVAAYQAGATRFTSMTPIAASTR